MPQQPQPSVVNNFSKGFKTEFTGLNFPEDALVDVDNCVPTLIGNIERRRGIDYEENSTTQTVDRASKALSTYKWNNVGGDGSTQIVVTQIGSTLYFYRSSSATASSPLSAQLLGSTITISTFTAAGGTFDATLECQFADGNGYLFVFHPSCDPFYCTYDAGTIAATKITVQIRDFAGLNDSLADSARPSTLSTEHSYNLHNQGWVQGTTWSADTGFPATIGPSGGSNTFSINSESTAGGITVGEQTAGTFTGYLGGNGFQANYTGSVTAYTSGVSITETLTSYSDSAGGTSANTGIFTSRVNTLTKTGAANYITTWSSQVGNYPSNSDVWFAYKNSSNVFLPSSTLNNVTISGLAPKGGIILDAFNQMRSAVSGVTGITNVITTVRPRTGAFFQGRVWYAGADSSQAATGDSTFTTWTENIYFSQVIERPNQFGRCYQVNNPTDETFFDLLPTDGGVIVIQGSGSIYKLFPIQNGLLVFAANGVWYITGSQGIGFSANDYVVVKISNVQSISGTSFVNVLGVPYWWNEEGIYMIDQGDGPQYGSSGRGSATNRGLTAENIAVGTILSFYGEIPLQSKKFARGSYNPVDFVIQWVYRDTDESSVTDRYEFNRVLNFNTSTNAFYPWTVASSPHIHDVMYVAGPGGSTSPSPVFKYFTSNPDGGSYDFTFSEESDDTNWVDWFSLDSVGDNYSSYLVSGYRVKEGNAQRKFQTNYLWVYSNNTVNTQYRIQSLWSYAIDPNSNKYTTLEFASMGVGTSLFSNVVRRHRVRGRGLVNQFRIESVDGQPFNIIGWSVQDMVNTGV